MSTFSKHLSELRANNFKGISNEGEDYKQVLSFSFLTTNTDFHDEQDMPTWESEKTNLVI